MRRIRPSAWLVACILSFASLSIIDGFCIGQEVAEKSTLNPNKVDKDFEFQGEYSGEVSTDSNKLKLGVQIVALGSGRFQLAGYVGGLPGDGWTPDSEVQRGEGGEVKDGELTFKGEYEVKIKNGLLTVFSGGNRIAECKKVVRTSPSVGMKPPAEAVVLFDGTSADQFVGFPVKDNLLDGDLLTQGVMSKQKFQDFTLHLEFLLSYVPTERGQSRANSGCYCQGRYEVQILDSFGLKGEDNECGGIYSVKKPDLNMCFPPLSWQTYDIDFTAARFDSEGKKTENARMTVKHNGVLIHKNVEVPKATTAAPVKERPENGPIYLQDHGNPIRFRNIWLVEKK